MLPPSLHISYIVVGHFIQVCTANTLILKMFTQVPPPTPLDLTHGEVPCRMGDRIYIGLVACRPRES